MSKEQRIGAIIILSIGLIVWFVYAFKPQPVLPTAPDPTINADSLRRDSIARVKAHRDSLREARWEHIKDSFRQIDDARFAQWAAERQARYDSFFLADSLWRDSVGMHRPYHPKKDTILNLNTTDTTELQLIRGIGSYTAKRIIRYREQLGGFYSPVQLTDEDLKDFHLDTLLHHFIASPDSLRTMNVNQCSVTLLAKHPYLRYEQAKAIYQLRRQHIVLKNIDALRALPELDSTDINRLQYYLRFDKPAVK